MDYTIDYLLKNSNLPGPRANLELLYAFSKNAPIQVIEACLAYNHESLSNSPEEFVVMCGVVGYCVNCISSFTEKKDKLDEVNECLKTFANHSSWRIRESVAIGLQEIAKQTDIYEILHFIEPWCKGTYYEQRAMVATICEPALLKNQTANLVVFDYLLSVTLPFNTYTGPLSDDQKSLRKALAYGWSVAIVACPDQGKHHFETLLDIKGKHIQWLIKENLKKNRLIKMDQEWVNTMTLNLRT